MRTKNLGFTLIEVLIAVFIIAIALAAVIQATNAGVRAAINVTNTLASHWVGENVVSELQTGLLVMPKSDDVLRGKTRMMNREWRWVAREKMSSQWPASAQITVTVRLNDKTVNVVTGYLAT
ncbi:MAG: type II secretion system protein GspI [Gammaproteobacteria bacterium RIFCSPLOWO2_02_FULL_42_14]|nr:MAG: type II secretion system protein GspI [Gammaproteobacteria bacterium RIFCSPHIGHO2_12_FULL_41_25]OGT61552.1 MAG: type II secretion system protein GspI [Gammaproteobacteria bacterium RIFCSPLOWO2_02_FULL_42_14]